MFALTTKTRSTEFFEGNRVNHLFHCPLDFAMECSSPWIKQSPLHHRLTFLLVHPRHDLWWFTWHIYIQNRVLDLGYEHIFHSHGSCLVPPSRAVVPSCRPSDDTGQNTTTVHPEAAERGLLGASSVALWVGRTWAPIYSGPHDIKSGLPWTHRDVARSMVQTSAIHP